LGDGPPCFPRDWRGPWYSGCVCRPYGFSIQGCHFLWPRFPAVFCYPHARLALPSSGLTLLNPIHATATALHMHGLGSSLFARRYLGNRSFFLFLGLLRCFSSPGLLHIPMCSVCDTSGSPEVGSPIRISPDLSSLAAPRGVSPLAASFFAPLRLGIHRVPFVA
jgi:hypothetical protein